MTTPVDSELPEKKPPIPRDSGGEVLALAMVAMPIALSYIAEMAMSVADTVIIGGLGTLQLAAAGLVTNVLFTLLFVDMSLLSIVGVLAAHAYGAGDSGRIAVSVRQGFWVATIASIPFMALGWNLGPILLQVGQEPAVVAYAEDYAHSLVWCFLPYMWFTVLRNFVSALARPMSVTVITIGAIGLNAFLVYGLVTGSFGLPELGLFGAGLGTTTVCFLMFAALAVHVMRAPELRKYRVFDDLLRVDFQVWWEMLRQGVPVAGTSFVESMLFVVVNLLMGLFGAFALAANQIVNNALSLVFMVPAAIAQAATVRVAYCLGAERQAEARRAGLIAIGMSAAFMLLVALALWPTRQFVAGLYLDAGDVANRDALALAGTLLTVAVVFQIVDGVQITAMGALRGLRDTLVPFLMALVGYWGVGLVSGCVFAFGFGLGPMGLWAGLAAGLTVAAVLLTWRYHHRTARMVAVLDSGSWT